MSIEFRTRIGFPTTPEATQQALSENRLVERVKGGKVIFTFRSGG